MKKLAATIVLIALALAPSMAAAAPDLSEHDAWRAEITAARARAEALRQQLKADLERRKVERLANPPNDEFDHAREASRRVLDDSSLQRGDVVSTVDGLFMFVGKGDGERSADDFVPLGPRSGPRPPQR